MSSVHFKKQGNSYNNGGFNRNNNGLSLMAQHMQQAAKTDEIDNMMGFERFIPAELDDSSAAAQMNNRRTGWLANMHPTLIPNTDEHSSGSLSYSGVSGVDFYFLDEEGGYFKSTIKYDPYFLVMVKNEKRVHDVEEFLKKLLESCLHSTEVIDKDDLKQSNHLIGLKRTLVKLNFLNTNDLFEARRLLRPILQQNNNSQLTRDIYKDHHNSAVDEDVRLLIQDIREYDVPYHVRVSIDKDIRVGKWYTVTKNGFELFTERESFPDPVVMAFDIETTKAPLKFPDASIDQIMMISYMIDGEGFLITNREIISSDIEDFEYTPKPEYVGFFTIFNEPDELHLLKKFFEHIRDVRPTVISTFNGDFFDWPFVDNRSKIHGLNMYDEIGFAPDAEGEYKSSYCTHMDCFRWVKRDSYLPQGSQGLKAVTKVKLGYNPIEVDPELMVPYAYEKPQQLSEYSVSDAVATYYLYMKYVHPFIFSLCTIIPLNPDEVLRKGTGTLCEMLLMVQAYEHGILLPNKHTDPIERFYDGHLLESETYVGGHVESLEAGVFRSDLDSTFNIDTTAIDELLEELPRALKFSIEVESNAKMEDVTNFDEIKSQITTELLELKAENKRSEKPLIYHVDVASMYPNIMITNRLQPDSMKSERDCASCDFNRPGKRCDRRLDWAWRGEFFPAKMDEYGMVKRALQNENFPNKNRKAPNKFLTFDELSYTDQVAHIKKRLSDYSKNVYHRTKVSETVTREAIVCQRENPFYANTVRSFRDRRYDYKGRAKDWKKKLSQIPSSDKHGKDEAKKMVVLNDSLQLAHKVILNSFYGYVMRKGSRWYSMEMAGITCLTGATIIQMARKLVERIGRPLELDTDGIWCIIPKSFPEDYKFKLKNGKSLFMSYPCSMLNYRVHQHFTNDQYQTLDDPVRKKYTINSENSIFFEVDGPYKAMILPTSKEEGKGIKKRYAVFNDDGSLAELKGFELKRRGELQLIKNFQNDIFKMFLEGTTLEECYGAVAQVADRWLDILYSKGAMLEDEDLIELICENRSMSKTLKEYEGQKSTSITTAKRLGEFLGEDMVKDKGLQCKYIISSKPHGAPVTERAVPVAIFSSDLEIKRAFLRKWLMDFSLDDFDPRAIIDWEYYKERLGSTIQKIITMPAALQDVENPVPRVEHPDWLKKKIATKKDKFKQTSLNRFFTKLENPKEKATVNDIEDMFAEKPAPQATKTSHIVSKRKRNEEPAEEEQLPILPEECPNPDVDYVSFLKYSKIRWKQQELERKRRETIFGSKSNSIGRSALGGFLKKHAESYAKSTWEVLQYKPSKDLDTTDVHLRINEQIHTIKIKTPKVVYCTFKKGYQPDAAQFSDFVIEKSATKHSQGGTTAGSQNTYKITLSHQLFESELKSPCSLFNHSALTGIFEANISSTERAVMSLGSTIEFNSRVKGALGIGLEKGFNIADLKAVESDRYLQRFDMMTCYLLHIVTNIGYEFFLVHKSWDETCEVFVKKPTSSAQELNQKTLVNMFKAQYQKKFEKVSKFEKFIKISDHTEFAIIHDTDVKKVHRKLEKTLSQAKDEHGSKLVLLLQSPYINSMLLSVNILNSIPLIHFSMAELKLPQINWVNVVCKRFVNHLLSLGSWISNLLMLSKYSNIPIGNMNLDNLGYMLDVLYARKLTVQNIGLWWNDKQPLPDYGGEEKNLDITSFFQNSMEAINNSEIYDTVVLEVEMSNLMINTVLASTMIHELEGSDLADVDGGSLIEDGFNPGALSILRQLMKELWDSVMTTNNITAESLLQTFVLWVQNPESKLYDHSLNYHVQNLANKGLLRLIKEFGSLGSTCVFADKNKVLLKTSKLTVENAYAYGQYIIKSVRTDPLFTYLNLNIKNYWDILIWMDQYNYGGRAATNIKEDKEEQELWVFGNWNIKGYLAPIYRPEFEDWLVIILDSLIKTKVQKLVDLSDGTQRITQFVPVTGNTDQLEEKETVKVGMANDFLEGFTTSFHVPLLKRLKKLYANQQEYILDPAFADDYAIPRLPGVLKSPSVTNNPLLELAKSLFRILLLSNNRNIEVRKLRKEVLKLFQVREFDPKAEFQVASVQISIYDFTCEYCFYQTEIELCKLLDPTVLNCGGCQKKYNLFLMQEKLIQMVEIELQNFYTQDLKCSKCLKIKEDLMSEYCNCSGKWVETIPHHKQKLKLNVFKQIAAFYGFDLLKTLLNDLNI
ncbi:DNA polymerase epsilon catalytic subunit [Hanseniaspora vineae]